MELTVNSRTLGRKVTFSKPGNYYIYVDLNGLPGTLGKQICDGGYLLGNTIGTDSTNYETFKKICLRWWKLYLRKNYI